MKTYLSRDTRRKEYLELEMSSSGVISNGLSTILFRISVAGGTASGKVSSVRVMRGVMISECSRLVNSIP